MKYTKEICHKCRGTGEIPRHKDYAEGLCFNCYGVGREPAGGRSRETIHAEPEVSQEEREKRKANEEYWRLRSQKESLNTIAIALDELDQIAANYKLRDTTSVNVYVRDTIIPRIIASLEAVRPDLKERAAKRVLARMPERYRRETEAHIKEVGITLSGVFG